MSIEKVNHDSLGGRLARHLVQHAAVITRIVEYHHRMLLALEVSKRPQFFANTLEELLKRLKPGVKVRGRERGRESR